MNTYGMLSSEDMWENDTTLYLVSKHIPNITVVKNMPTNAGDSGDNGFNP